MPSVTSRVYIIIIITIICWVIINAVFHAEERTRVAVSCLILIIL